MTQNESQFHCVRKNRKQQRENKHIPSLDSYSQAVSKSVSIVYIIQAGVNISVQHHQTLSTTLCRLKLAVMFIAHFTILKNVHPPGPSQGVRVPWVHVLSSSLRFRAQ